MRTKNNVTQRFIKDVDTFKKSFKEDRKAELVEFKEIFNKLYKVKNAKEYFDTLTQQVDTAMDKLDWLEQKLQEKRDYLNTFKYEHRHVFPEGEKAWFHLAFDCSEYARKRVINRKDGTSVFKNLEYLIMEKTNLIAKLKDKIVTICAKYKSIKGENILGALECVK